ncbi:MAG: tRNA uridine-5-carboxymethylaminomethyl(34) synthesis GTPase MnmE [Verrucomicrobia bacterium]|nr:tRNA uridine-5-carboxymethylaminomethyl(34) synthesis GTPase MnmE [Verrucomicrobiota bacterium]
MPSRPDTIVAPATAAGAAALAVVRISGPDAARLDRELFPAPASPRTARHADFHDRDGRLVDDVVATFHPGPRSYSGEDLLEISCHGSPFIVQKILEDLLARGCRAAGPGEFTQRAFLNGRLDLSQAEAVMDLIHARSERALVAAQQQLRGALGRTMNQLTDRLLGVLARVEAYIDFPDEDLPTEDRSALQTALEAIWRDTDRLLATQHYGEMLRHGIKTVIVGAPNAGKSSLLNRLVGRERAIVSPEPGTTRDFIEEQIVIGPHSLRLIDTAGLNPAPGTIEKLGIEKSLERVAEADLILLVIEAGQPVPAFPRSLLERLVPGRCVVIVNKVDQAPPPSEIVFANNLPVVQASALTGLGFDQMVAQVTALADAFQVPDLEDSIAINARHADALVRAKTGLRDALAKLAGAAPSELLASDLRGTLDAYGDIVGKVDNERMLDQLFATFCIGK